MNCLPNEFHRASLPWTSADHNASRPVSRVLYGRGFGPDVTAIPLGRPLPDASSNQPERPGLRKRPRGRTRASLLFGFAPGGACHAADVAASAVRSCRTLSPLPSRRCGRSGGLLSVAL